MVSEGEKLMITSNIAFYPCISIEETEAFYKNIIGLELVFSGGKARIFSAVKGHFGFVEYPDKKAATGRFCLSLNCSNEEYVDLEYDRIVALGAKPLDKPKVHENHPVYSFFIEDPNGYLVEFQKIKNFSL